MATKNEAKPRPHGKIKFWESGHAFFPKNLRDELKVDKDKRLPYFIDATTILITREGMTTEELVDELERLKDIVKARVEEE